jgi:hypothetical protein
LNKHENKEKLFAGKECKSFTNTEPKNMRGVCTPATDKMATSVLLQQNGDKGIITRKWRQGSYNKMVIRVLLQENGDKGATTKWRQGC